MWLAGVSPTLTPAGAYGNDILSYILGFGPVGVFLLALAWLLYKGWSLSSPDRAARQREECRADLIEQRTQLLADITRLQAAKEKVEAQRDEALRLAQEKLVPALYQFTSVTGALIPILQQLVARGDLPRPRSSDDR